VSSAFQSADAGFDGGTRFAWGLPSPPRIPQGGALAVVHGGGAKTTSVPWGAAHRTTRLAGPRPYGSGDPLGGNGDPLRPEIAFRDWRNIARRGGFLGMTPAIPTSRGSEPRSRPRGSGERGPCVAGLLQT